MTATDMSMGVVVCEFHRFDHVALTDHVDASSQLAPRRHPETIPPNRLDVTSASPVVQL